MASAMHKSRTFFPLEKQKQSVKDLPFDFKTLYLVCPYKIKYWLCGLMIISSIIWQYCHIERIYQVLNCIVYITSGIASAIKQAAWYILRWLSWIWFKGSFVIFIPPISSSAA